MIASPSVNPGRLDRRLTLLSPLGTRSESGARIDSWATTATVWGQWLPQGGREFTSAQARHAEATGLFRLRYRSDLTPEARLVCEGALYEVLAITELGRREYLELAVRSLYAASGEIQAPTVKAFLVDLAADVSEVAVTYATAFDSAPAGLWIKVLPPAGGYNIDANPIEATRTASGFTAQLAATTPATGYRLSVIAIQ